MSDQVFNLLLSGTLETLTMTFLSGFFGTGSSTRDLPVLDPQTSTA